MSTIDFPHARADCGANKWGRVDNKDHCANVRARLPVWRWELSAGSDFARIVEAGASFLLHRTQKTIP